MALSGHDGLCSLRWWNGGRRYAVAASLAYLHGRFNRGEPVDWAVYEGAKERLRELLEVREKALAFRARLRELEEGERPTAYFFQASRARRGASAIAGLRRADGTLVEGLVMLAVAESYYAKLFSRRACEAYLLHCISARLGGEEVQSMEADVTLEEVRQALLSLRLPKEFYAIFWNLLGPDLLEVYRALLERASSYSCTKGVTGQYQDRTNGSGVPLLVVRQVRVHETGADVRSGGGEGGVSRGYC
ncbi:hypothetical protein AAFF_G00219970 [Aldrovandia affinis]|uniref:Uncharacterized protein n=1 Tax=Aldrovandia affinis TaxID=143900 RepID=A0AAD7RG01_9TELE|nr:hypothetical protein AAFF_G00219970 [Aldrovandia affinis]